MREPQIIDFMARLAVKQPEWLDLVKGIRDGMEHYRRMGGMTLSLFSDRLDDDNTMERCRLTLGFSEQDLTVGMGDFHHIHYEWDAEGEEGVEGAYRFALDLVEERMGIASVDEDGYPATLWVFNTANNLPLTDRPRMIFPRRRGFRWPWHKPRFMFVTSSYHGTHNSIQPLTAEVREKYEVPLELRPPPDGPLHL